MTNAPHFSNLHDALAPGARVLDALQGTVLTAAGRSYVLPEAEVVLRESIDGIEEFRISARRTFNALRPFVRLPKDIIKAIAREFVRVAEPRTKSSRAKLRCGWLVILWLCHDIREVVYDDPHVFALAYSQFPARLKQMKTLCRGVGPLIVIDKAHPWSPNQLYNNSAGDTFSLDKKMSAYDWKGAAAIHLENRGNVPAYIDHLMALSKDSPLNSLKDLSLWLASTSKYWSWFDKVNSKNYRAYLDVPSLETVVFDGIWIPFRSLALRSLTLWWAIGGPYSAPSALRLAEVLLDPHASTLTRLCIIDAIRPIEEVILGDHVLPTVTMLNLARLELGGAAGQLLPLMLMLPINTVPVLLLRLRTTCDHSDDEDLAQWSALRAIGQVGKLIKQRCGGHRNIRMQCARDVYAQHHITFRLWNAETLSDHDLKRDADFTFELITSPNGPLEWHDAWLALAPFVGLINVSRAAFALQCRKRWDHADVNNEVWKAVLRSMPALQQLDIDRESGDRAFIEGFLSGG